MEFKSVRCPSCGGIPEKQDERGNYYCESCGTTFVLDYDPEDAMVEKSRIDLQAQRERHRHEDQVWERGKSQRRLSILAPFIALIFPVTIIVFLVLFAVSSHNAHNESLRQQTEAMQAEKAEKEAARIASYQVDVSQISAEDWASLKQGALDSFQNKLNSDTGNPLWTYWEDCTTSDLSIKSAYYLQGDAEGYEEDKNLLYFVMRWRVTSNDAGNPYEFVVYSPIWLSNIQMIDGKIKTDYRYECTYHSEYFGKHTYTDHYDGYQDFDAMYREEIMAKSEYEVTDCTNLVQK